MKRNVEHLQKKWKSGFVFVFWKQRKIWISFKNLAVEKKESNDKYLHKKIKSEWTLHNIRIENTISASFWTSFFFFFFFVASGLLDITYFPKLQP